MLKAETYNCEEKLALKYLPNRMIQAAQCYIFNQTGYPSYVEDDTSLYKFADAMHELRAEETFNNILGGGINETEFLICSTIQKKVFTLSKENYKKAVIPFSSLLRALNVYRFIEIISLYQKCSILEIGPGSGYLGGYLLCKGYEYIATDNSQAFYLFQNHLFNSINNGNISEAVGDSNYFEGYKKSNIKALHIPWWEFFSLREKTNLKFKIITCNHGLAEMHGLARSYLLTIADQMLTDDGILIFEGFGYNPKLSIQEICNHIESYGFQKLYFDSNIFSYAKNTNVFQEQYKKAKGKYFDNSTLQVQKEKIKSNVINFKKFQEFALQMQDENLSYNIDEQFLQSIKNPLGW